MSCNKTKEVEPPQAKDCKSHQYYSDSLKSCVNYCSDEKIYNVETGECYSPGKKKKCQSNKVQNDDGSCECAEEDFWHEDKQKCIPVPKCPKGWLTDLNKVQCITPCKNGFVYNHNKYRCELPCEKGLKFDIGEQRCIPICNGTTYLNISKSECIEAKLLKFLNDRPSVLRDIRNKKTIEVCISYLREETNFTLDQLEKKKRVYQALLFGMAIFSIRFR